MRHPAAGLLALALLAVLSVVACLSAQRGLAEVIAQQPRYEIERWRSGELAADAPRLDAMQAALNEARNLDPRNPRLLEELALFRAERVDGRYNHNPEVREARQESLAWFRQVLEQRPTSGHAWFNVALMKFRLDAIDQEFSQSLQQAIRRSPWEPKVQLRVIELGLANWQGLAAPLRETLKQAIHAQAHWQLVSQKPALQLLLKRYGRADLDYLL
jgi:hypothetical protein